MKYEAQRAKKIASKSHRERIKELNEVGWAASAACLLVRHAFCLSSAQVYMSRSGWLGCGGLRWEGLRAAGWAPWLGQATPTA